MLNLGNVTLQEISKVLNDYLVENKIDDDGDLLINGIFRIYIRVQKDRGVIRFFSFISPESLKDISDKNFDVFLDFINGSSYSVKYSKIGLDSIRSPILCEYGISSEGKIDDIFMVKTIKMIEKEISQTVNTSSKFELMISEHRENANTMEASKKA